MSDEEIIQSIVEVALGIRGVSVELAQACNCCGTCSYLVADITITDPKALDTTLKTLSPHLTEKILVEVPDVRFVVWNLVHNQG